MHSTPSGCHASLLPTPPPHIDFFIKTWPCHFCRMWYTEHCTTLPCNPCWLLNFWDTCCLQQAFPQRQELLQLPEATCTFLVDCFSPHNTQSKTSSGGHPCLQIWSNAAHNSLSSIMPSKTPSGCGIQCPINDTMKNTSQMERRWQQGGAVQFHWSSNAKKVVRYPSTFCIYDFLGRGGHAQFWITLAMHLQKCCHAG